MSVADASHQVHLQSKVGPQFRLTAAALRAAKAISSPEDIFEIESYE